MGVHDTELFELWGIYNFKSFLKPLHTCRVKVRHLEWTEMTQIDRIHAVFDRRGCLSDVAKTYVDGISGEK
jgi:hypothetical protein